MKEVGNWSTDPRRSGDRPVKDASDEPDSLRLFIIDGERTTVLAYGAKRAPAALESELDDAERDMPGGELPAERSSAPVRLLMLPPRRRFCRTRDLSGRRTQLAPVVDPATHLLLAQAAEKGRTTTYAFQ